MILFYEKESDIRARVYSIVNDLDSLTEDEKSKGVLVDELPEKIEKPGEFGRYYINPKTNEIWVEYEQTDLTQEEEMSILKAKQTLMQQAIDDIIMGGMM